MLVGIGLAGLDNHQRGREMSKPVLADRLPAVLELEAGTYWWWACGLSKTQPFCDGAHKQEGVFSPLKLELPEARRVALCQCKYSENQPLCDGNHSRLD